MEEGSKTGLQTRTGAPLPLKGVAVHVAARGPASRVTVAQSYRNEEDQAVEAVYTFPLPEEAAVCGFQLEQNGQVLRGRVEDKEKCLEEYDSALARGAGAFLLDQDRPNVFTAYVGNLRPQEEVVLRLTYVAPLTWLPDGLQIIVPTVVSPRYFPEEQVRTMDPAELLHLSPPAVLGPLPYGFTLTLDLEVPGSLLEVECPSHPFRWELAAGRLKGAVAGVARMDQDFVLNLRLGERHQPFCLRAKEPGGATVLLVGFNPELPQASARQPLEVIFLVDCSGSMAGESAAQARNALDLCLRALEEGDAFNIVAFGSEWKPLFQKSQSFSQANLDQAAAFVQTLDGQMGGTELLPPLKAIFKRPAPAGRVRKVILLTDGEVANEAEILALVQRHRGKAAIYPVGLGRGPNAHLLRSLARISGGAAELVHPQARLEPVMVRLFEKVASPTFGPVAIHWDGLTPDLTAPEVCSPLHVGEHFLALARFAGQSPRKVRIAAGGPGVAALAWELEPTDIGDPDDGVLPVMLAREAIRELEDRHLACRWRPQTKEAEALKRRILELSKQYGLLSSLTSFLVVAERPGAEAGEPVMRRIPVALTRGWGGLEELAPYAFKPAFSADICCHESPSIPGFDYFDYDAAASLPKPSQPASVPQPDPEEQGFRRLMQAQQAPGSWPLTRWLARQAGSTLKTLKRLARRLNLPPQAAEEIIATLTALYLLHTRFPKWEAEWRLSAAKAERWLASQGVALTLPPSEADFPTWWEAICRQQALPNQ